MKPMRYFLDTHDCSLGRLPEKLSPDSDAVKRAHARVGLPFDSITEVHHASPGDRFFRRPASA